MAISHFRFFTLAPPLPYIDPTNPTTPTTYLYDALLQSLAVGNAFLTAKHLITPPYRDATLTLKPAPDGSYILSHTKKDRSSQNTNFVISLTDPHAYALLATSNNAFKIPLPTTTEHRGISTPQVTLINLSSHTRSVLGRNYVELLTDPDIIRLNQSLPPLTFEEAHGLQGRRGDKMAWAITLLQNPVVLTAYEAHTAAAEAPYTDPIPTGPSVPQADTQAATPSGYGGGGHPQDAGPSGSGGGGGGPSHSPFLLLPPPAGETTFNRSSPKRQNNSSRTSLQPRPANRPGPRSQFATRRRRLPWPHSTPTHQQQYKHPSLNQPHLTLHTQRTLLLTYLIRLP